LPNSRISLFMTICRERMCGLVISPRWKQLTSELPPSSIQNTHPILQIFPQMSTKLIFSLVVVFPAVLWSSVIAGSKDYLSRCVHRTYLETRFDLPLHDQCAPASSVWQF
jgi:hypothetical protein